MELHLWENRAESICDGEGGEVKRFLWWEFAKQKIETLIATKRLLGMVHIIAHKITKCDIVINFHISVCPILKKVICKLIWILLFKVLKLLIDDFKIFWFDEELMGLGVLVQIEAEHSFVEE